MREETADGSSGSDIAKAPAGPAANAADPSSGPLGIAGRVAFVGVLLAACALRLELTASLPTAYREAWVDDLLYAQTADHLIHGEWLGPYDVRILTKEPGYPLFLAAAS